MRGFVIKDVYILKKNLGTFPLTTLGVMMLGVLFSLSIKYGNVAEILEEMKKEPYGEEAFFAHYQVAVWVVLILPVAFISMIVECFKQDAAAGFYKVRGSLPLNSRKVVGARYITMLLLAGAGLFGSLFSGYMVSLSTEVYSFSTICKFAVSIFSVILICTLMQLPFYYFFNGKKTDLIMAVPVYVVGILLMYQLFKMDAEDDALYHQQLFQMVEKISRIFTDYVWVLPVVAVVVLLISFWISCRIAERRTHRMN